MGRSDPRLSGDGIQASKENQIEDSALVLFEVGVVNGLSHGGTVDNVLFGEITLISADSLLGKGGKERVQAPYEGGACRGRNDVDEV